MGRSPLTLADFCQFTVRDTSPRADQTLLAGEFTKPGRLSCGSQLYVFVNLDEGFHGTLIEFSPDTRQGVLEVVTTHLCPALTIGSTFPVYDSYWTGRLDLVLDDHRQWKRVKFTALDAFVAPAETPGWRKWRIAAPGDDLNVGGEIVPGGWDHEHCEICWQKIGNYGDDEGYLSNEHDWVCAGCFHSYIKPRDLRFVIETAADDPVESDDHGTPTPFQTIVTLIDEYDLPELRAFLNNSPSVNSRSKYGWTPLMIAASNGHLTLISLLLEAGADVNACSEQHGYTALALAAQKGFVAVVEKLLIAGATTWVPETFWGGSLLNYVKSGPGRDNSKLAELLRQAGAT